MLNAPPFMPLRYSNNTEYDAGSSVQACEVSGRHILALEEDPATFRTFMKDIAILPSAYVASDVNRVRNLAQHLDELDSNLTLSHAAMSGSSRGIAS